MITRIQKWGNSQGLRLPRAVLADAGIAVGTEVDVAVEDGVLVIRPARRVRGKHDLADLVRRLPSGQRHREVDWGPPTGREVW